MTQQAFGDKLGLKRNTVGGYEVGIVDPSDRTIIDICRKFGIQEKWLRTGEGEMENPLSRDEEIATYIGEILQKDSDDFQKRLFLALSKLSQEEWELIEKIVGSLSE